MSFTVEHVEFYLLVLIRITSFVIGAPIFGYQTIPMKIRLAIGMVLSLAAIQTVPVIELNYVGVLGFSVLVLKEMIVGLTIGFMCNYVHLHCFFCRTTHGHGNGIVDGKYL